MKELQPQDLKRRVEEQSFDPHATKEAINLLSSLRMKYPSEIPLAAWKMMQDAERIMNKELERYFKPEDSQP